MGQILNTVARGIFPVIGEQFEDGVCETVRGFGTWNADNPPNSGECRLTASFHSGDTPPRLFADARVDADREFVKRLASYDRSAHADLVEAVDWPSTVGFDIHSVDCEDPCVYATYGHFPFALKERKSTMWAMWKTLGPEDDSGKRCIMARLGDSDLHGETDVESGLVGDLASDAPEARERLVESMGWNMNELGVSLQ